MVSLRRKDDGRTPAAVYNFRVWAMAAIASMASVMIGYDSAFVGGTLALQSFVNEFGALTGTTQANIVSVYQVGAFFGAFFGYPLGHFLGRKRGLFFCAAFFTIGAAVMCATNKSTGLAPLYAGRTLAGLAIGSASNLTPIYIAEIAPTAIRGQLVGVYELGWQIGGLVGFWINYGVDQTMAPSHTQWLIPFAIQLIPGALFWIGTLFLIESPRWLLTRGRETEAMAALSRVRNLPSTDAWLVDELATMNAAVLDERRLTGDGFWAPFRETFLVPRILRRVLLGCSLFIWQNGCGINAINYYSPTVFKSIGISGTSTSLLSTGLFGVIKTVGSIVWILFLIDHVGRRILLIVGALGGSFCMYYIAAYLAISKVGHRPPSSSLSPGGKSALAFFYIWTVFYSPTWNGTPWVLNSEMFMQQNRTLAQACAAASNWLFNFCIARFTPQMFAAMGYGVYLFFASLMVLAAIYVYFLVPETKCIPLEEMDRLFSAPVRPWKAHAWLTAELASRPHLSGGAAPGLSQGQGSQGDPEAGNGYGETSGPGDEKEGKEAMTAHVERIA